MFSFFLWSLDSFPRVFRYQIHNLLLSARGWLMFEKGEISTTFLMTLLVTHDSFFESLRRCWRKVWRILRNIECISRWIEAQRTSKIWVCSLRLWSRHLSSIWFHCFLEMSDKLQVRLQSHAFLFTKNRTFLKQPEGDFYWILLGCLL
jgi:hypothetical protein